MFAIEVHDQGVMAVLDHLLSQGQNLGPALQKIGSDIVERAKGRFDTGTGPDGTPWKDNSPVTLARYLGKSAGNFKKSGDLSKKGAKRLASKKPLWGESGDLRRQIEPTVSGNTLTVSANPIYAAMQQFGGTKASYPNLWGNIPARPFLPVKQDGELYPAEQEAIVDVLSRYLVGYGYLS